MKYLEQLSLEYKLIQKITSKLKEMKGGTKDNIIETLANRDGEETDKVKISKSDISRTFYTKSKIKEAFKDTLSEDEIEACLKNIEPTEYTNVYVTIKDSALDLRVSKTAVEVEEKVRKECT